MLVLRRGRSVGRYLLAVVSYTDAKRNLDEDEAFDEELRDRAGMVSANPVAEDTRNRAPEFSDEDIENPTREVAEKTTANVGNPVTAVDPDPTRTR